MESIRELADAIYQERVLRARRTPIEQKILAEPSCSSGRARSRVMGSATRIRGSMRTRYSESFAIGLP